MSRIKEINLILMELRKELSDLEKAGPSSANLERVRWIEKRAKELKMARRMLQRQMGMYETA